MPTTRKNGCLASVGKNVYYTGSYYMDTANQQRMEMLIGTPIITSAPTFAPTIPPCSVTAPTNGALGTCSSTLAAGSSCQPSCNDGFGYVVNNGGSVAGATTCSATGTTLTQTTTCTILVWQSRNSVPKPSFYPLQSSVSYGTLLYTNTVPAIGASGDFHVYGSTTDLWVTGIGRRLFRAHAIECVRIR